MGNLGDTSLVNFLELVTDEVPRISQAVEKVGVGPVGSTKQVQNTKTLGQNTTEPGL
jgi:hypothetical protein